MLHARVNGVATDGVEWSSDGRLGLLFVELGSRPRPTASLYDRAESAFATLDPGAFDWPALLDGARALHTSGITPGAVAGLRAAAAEALGAARDGRLPHLLRPQLPRPPGHARTRRARRPRRWRRSIDTLIASAGEAAAVFGLDGEPAEVALGAARAPRGRRAS